MRLVTVIVSSPLGHVLSVLTKVEQGAKEVVIMRLTEFGFRTHTVEGEKSMKLSSEFHRYVKTCAMSLQ